MRKPLFTFAFFLFFTPVFAQKLLYKDIAGTWDAIDTSQSTPPFSIKFIDSSSMVFMTMGIELGKQPFTYKIDTSGNTTTLLIKGITLDGRKFNDQWLIKKSSDTLKVQSSFFSNLTTINQQENDDSPRSWDNNETFKNTGILIRRKN